MPMQMSGPQAQVKPTQFSEEQTTQLAAYVASLGAGPAIPRRKTSSTSLGNPAAGGEVFRVNCAMCHNASAAGGALTRGKFAGPGRRQRSTHLRSHGHRPQNMPVFSDANIPPRRSATSSPS